MVARINTSKSITKALNYNEQKVQQGRAELLQAINFLKDVEQLSFYDKTAHFERLTSLNEAAETNTVHISLSFHPTEQMEKDTLIAIAQAYMQGIGFGNQPYLVYQHRDAAHPHLHIVSTNIQWGETGFLCITWAATNRKKPERKLNQRTG